MLPAPTRGAPRPRPGSSRAPSPYQVAASPYQVAIAARERAGHLPGAGSPGGRCQALSGCRVSRPGHQVWGGSERQTVSCTAEMLPWASRAFPLKDFLPKTGSRAYLGETPWV